MLDSARIAELLRPYLDDAPTPDNLVDQLRAYLDLLLRWNARTNLTAVRDPEQIVTRHFGESLFAARILHAAGALSGTPTLSDIGSGAGFPGIPIKLFAPGLHLTLIESQNKKATFLREVVRALQLTTIDIFGDRAERLGRQFNIVTLRAVEKFDSVLPVAANLVAPSGTLCLLIGQGQQQAVGTSLGSAWDVSECKRIPQSDDRIVYLAIRHTLRCGN